MRVERLRSLRIIQSMKGQRAGHRREPSQSGSGTQYMPVEPSEVVEVEKRTVSCDGSGGALGHPRVYLNLGDDGQVDCPYCDREFLLKADVVKAAGH